MTQNNEPAMMEEIVLPEHLLPLGSVLGQGVTALDLCMVLAKIFRVQYTEVALLRLEGGLLRFVFPEYLRTTGSIPLNGKAVAAHTALSKKAEIFNNFARVKHASIFETIKAGGETEEAPAPAPIQKLMSVPIMDRNSNVVGVIQISRKGMDSRFAQDFSREDLHDLELAAGLLATAPLRTKFGWKTHVRTAAIGCPAALSFRPKFSPALSSPRRSSPSVHPRPSFPAA
jgi:hypothetical protein